MDAYKIAVKFFAQGKADVSDEAFVLVFHRWIQEKAVGDHLLIDVADYAHVHKGPGIALISLEANFYADRLGGRLGLTYHRKHPAEGDFQARLAQAVRAALEACVRLEQAPELGGKLKFAASEAQVRIHDRLLAPNTPQTLEQIRPAVEAVFGKLSGTRAVSIEQAGDPVELFDIRVKWEANAPIEGLAGRI